MKISDAELLGRLNGQRRLLVNVLAMLAAEPERARKLADLAEETAVTADHQEDPGAVPSLAFSIRHHADEEIRSIISDALARAGRD